MKADCDHRLELIASFLDRCMTAGRVLTGDEMQSLHACASGAVLNQIDSTDIPRHLRRRPAVKCLQCMVEVPADKLTMPARCVDAHCPLSVLAKEPA